MENIAGRMGAVKHFSNWSRGFSRFGRERATTP
jgi:hypothetical protein